MSGVVLDASTALAWCFADEISEYADRVLMALEGETVLVPAVWSLEITNAVLTGERKKRLGQPEIARFLSLLGSLSVTQDNRPAGDNMAHVLPVAREYGLSAYDAAYLELSIRHNARLATLDDRLKKAAKLARVKIFVETPARTGATPAGRTL